MTGEYWLVYKGQSFDLWNPDTGTYYASVDVAEITSHLQEKRLRQQRTITSPFSMFSKNHVKEPATLPCKHPRITFRNVTNAIDSRTVIAALIPEQIVLVNSAPYLLWPEGFTVRHEAYLLGVLSSMTLDWYARRVVVLNLNFHLLNNFPIPTADINPETGSPIALRVVEIAGRLAAVDARFSKWAAEVGVPVGSANDEPVKTDLICELDACVAHLYGLDEDDLDCLYTTFHARPDEHAERHADVLEHFRKLPRTEPPCPAPS